MRITGGHISGRKLCSPKDLNIRPTSDRVREAIFNIIGHDLSNMKILDLFAGIGSLGLEALSRNAKNALFIDNSQKAINLIKKNLVQCGYVDIGQILRRDLKKGLLQNHLFKHETFDLVFIDPPYRKDYLPSLLEQLSEGEILSANAKVIAESSKHEVLSSFYGDLEMSDIRIYGDTKINIYKKMRKKV